MNVVTILLILTAVVIILLLINTYLSYKASKASNENLLGQFQTAWIISRRASRASRRH